jgi:predicted metalloprotease
VAGGIYRLSKVGQRNIQRLVRRRIIVVEQAQVVAKVFREKA